MFVVLNEEHPFAEYHDPHALRVLLHRLYYGRVIDLLYKLKVLLDVVQIFLLRIEQTNCLVNAPPKYGAGNRSQPVGDFICLHRWHRGRQCTVRASSFPPAFSPEWFFWILQGWHKILVYVLLCRCVCLERVITYCREFIVLFGVLSDGWLGVRLVVIITAVSLS